MKVSINEIASLTGKDRRTITERLSDLPYEDGPKGAHCYDSERAFLLIYTTDANQLTLEEARTRQAISQSELNEIRTEELRKTRIPIQLISEILDSTMQTFAATLKAARGQVLTSEKINDLMAKLSTAKIPESW